MGIGRYDREREREKTEKKEKVKSLEISPQVPFPLHPYPPFHFLMSILSSPKLQLM